MPHVFQQEAGRPPHEGAPSYADQGGEDSSNDAAKRIEKHEGEWGVQLESDEADQERERQRDQEFAP